MTTIILGHLVLDEIHSHAGDIIAALGGIFFPVGAFGALAGTDDIVRPVFPVGHDAWDQYLAATREFPAIDLSWSLRVDEPNTRVRLFHDAQAQYNTQLVSSLAPIDLSEAAPALREADLVYLNMMTGHDLVVEDAERIRGMTDGLVYLDLHMIAYRVARDGHRTTAQVPDWERWANVPHVLQCNERELAVLGDADGPAGKRVDALFAVSSLDMVVVTRGERGSTVYPRGSTPFDVPGVTAPKLIDTTGCGDVFGSTFAWHLARGFQPGEAGIRASHAAAYIASIPGSIGIGALRHHLSGNAS